jgi:hypothetical protein
LGWTDDIIGGLSLRRYLEITRAIIEERREQERERWQLAAFVGWQIASCFAAQGEGMAFGEYLAQFGLVEQAQAQATPKPKKSAKELIAWAQALTDRARAEKAGESS